MNSANRLCTTSKRKSAPRPKSLLFENVSRAHLIALACIATQLVVPTGCRRLAPIHVWQPAGTPVPMGAKLAMAPVAGDVQLANEIENHLFAQRPAARADLAMFTADQLLDRSPVRLASTAALNHDAMAIQAARSAGADYLLQGEVLSANLKQEREEEPTGPINYNQLFFQRTDKPTEHEDLIVTWRVVDVASGQTVGSHVVNITSEEATSRYPDLAVLESSGESPILAAAARETWKLLAPVVIEDKVRLATSTLMPGSIGVRIGNRLARRGQWQAAEQHWKRAADWFWFNAAAQHNLAIAYAAREDFDAAKSQLEKAQSPLSFRLPNESLFWLDHTHRAYVEAHGLPQPANGWSFNSPQPTESVESVQPVAPEELPWWTAIPLVKPPGWTWKDWLTQPIVF